MVQLGPHRRSPASHPRPRPDGSKQNHHTNASNLESGLYVVATPIGNLGDVTYRAIDILRRADVIACEDTRVTGRLMKRYGLMTALISYHDHNAARVRPRLLSRLTKGEAVAIVSDAGTPVISDPGYRLIKDTAEAGHRIIPVPGASALLAGIMTSGLPSDRIFFAGFLPQRSPARRRTISELRSVQATLVFFESSRRLTSALKDMADILGPRAVTIGRELTKIHEQTYRGHLDTVAHEIASIGPIKGEVVVVVEAGNVGKVLDRKELDASLTTALSSMSVRDAVATIAKNGQWPRSLVYERALALKANQPL